MRLSHPRFCECAWYACWCRWMGLQNGGLPRVHPISTQRGVYVTKGSVNHIPQLLFEIFFGEIGSFCYVLFLIFAADGNVNVLVGKQENIWPQKSRINYNSWTGFSSLELFVFSRALNFLNFWYLCQNPLLKNIDVRKRFLECLF